MAPTQQLIINVGGQVFATTHETINQAEDCMLKTLCTSQWHDNGEIFIDRDGTYFRKCLNWFRMGKTPLPSDKDTLMELLAEADFYGIETMQLAIEEQLQQFSGSKHVDAIEEEEEWQLLLRTVEQLRVDHKFDGGEMIASTIKEFIHTRSEALRQTFRAYKHSPELAPKLEGVCRERLFEFTQGSPVE